MADSARLFQIDADRQQSFFAAYGAARRAAGGGEALGNLSIRQRVDAAEVMAGLNEGQAWAIQPGDDAAALWLRFLAPVLCETAEARAVLRAVVGRVGLPGMFVPAVQGAVIVPPGPEETGTYFEKLNREIRAVLWENRLPLGVPAAVIAIAAAALLLQPAPPLPCDGAVPCPPVAVEIDPVPPVIDQTRLPKQPQRVVLSDYVAYGLPALDRVMTAMEVQHYELTPYRLAEYLAGSSPFGTDPALVLDAMLDRWPLPPHDLIPRSRAGAMALINFALAVDGLEDPAGSGQAAMRDAFATAEATQNPSQAETVDRFGPTLGMLSDADQADLYDDAAASDGLPSLWGLDSLDPRFVEFVSTDAATPLWQILSRSDGPPDPKADPDGVIIFEIGAGFPSGDQIEQRFGARPPLQLFDGQAAPFRAVALQVQTEVLAVSPLTAAMRPVTGLWPQWLIWLIFLPFLLALIWAVWSYRTAIRLGLDNPQQGQRGRLMFDVQVPAANPPGLSARRVADRLRFSAPMAMRSLDVDRSLTATLAKGGFFVPVRRQRVRRAEHVILIRQDHSGTHEPDRIARFAGDLDRAGTHVKCFHYGPDPGLLRDPAALGSPPIDLRVLRETYPDARLTLISDGRELLHPLKGTPVARLVDPLRQWTNRAVLTPVPFGEWGLREYRVSQALGCPVGRADSTGLADLAAVFAPRRPAGLPPVAGPGRAGPAEVRAWLARVRAWRGRDSLTARWPDMLRALDASASYAAPDPDSLRQLIDDLAEWLGTDTFRWLCAVAAYRQLRPALTRWIGTQFPNPDQPVFSEAGYAKLSLLPWFSTGMMPEWLRPALIGALTERDKTAIGGLFAALLDKRTPVPADGAAAGLALWKPDAAGVPLERDDVLLNLPQIDAPGVITALDMDRDAHSRESRQVLVWSRGAMLGGFALWTAVAYALWPERAQIPVPPGSWLAVWVVLAGGAVALGLAVVFTTAMQRLAVGGVFFRPDDASPTVTLIEGQPQGSPLDAAFFAADPTSADKEKANTIKSAA